MSFHAVLVTSKQPFGAREDGDIILSRVLVAGLADICERVTVVALSDEPPVAKPSVELIEIPKPELAWPELVQLSARRRRSLIHTRFAPEALVETLRGLDADAFVARRAYMAQAIIDAGRVPPRDRLCVVVDALESAVLSRRRSWLAPVLAAEARRTRRDELSCLRAASALAYVSDSEAADLRAELPPAPRLDFVLPPAEHRAGLEQPLALFVGDRTWAPNADALEQVLRIWPKIRAQIPGLRLRVVGRAGPSEGAVVDESIEVLGFVDDLEAMWREAGVLLAPVRIGGGVRMKVLDAVRHGVPVIGTPAAIGSADQFLPLTAHPLDKAFVDAAVRLLSDRDVRVASGKVLYDAGKTHYEGGVLQRQLRRLLGVGDGRDGPGGS